MFYANLIELTMLDLINGARDAEGLKQLRLITTLNDAADTHSSWMLNADVFSHAQADGSQPYDRMVEAGYLSEENSLATANIGWQSARGADEYEEDVAQSYDGLIASSEHRPNFLKPDAKDIGIGVKIGTYSGAGGDYEAVMVTQSFATTTAADISAWVDPGSSVADDDKTSPGVGPVDDVFAHDSIPIDGEAVLAEDDGAPLIFDTDISSVPVDGLVPENSAYLDRPFAGLVEDVAEHEGRNNQASEANDGNNLAKASAIVAAFDDEFEEDEETNIGTLGGDISDQAKLDASTLADPSLPSDLADFRVDLTSAFDLRHEGDQMVWETSQDRLMEVFMKAFEGWTGGQLEETDAEDTKVGDLMGSDSQIVDIEWVPEAEDPTDDWLASCGV